MTDYKKYINALRKCAKEHENDRTFTGHIIVSDLCRDTANLLETLEQQPESKIRSIPYDECAIRMSYSLGYSTLHCLMFLENLRNLGFEVCEAESEVV